MNALTPISGKIMPLIARLGSDSDPERLACLKQLDRVLGRAGVSWTDLALRISVADETPCCGSRRSTRPTTDGERVRWLLWEADGWRISQREAEFLLNIRDTAAFWRGDSLRSAKQSKWLGDIYSRVAREMGHA